MDGQGASNPVVSHGEATAKNRIALAAEDLPQKTVVERGSPGIGGTWGKIVLVHLVESWLSMLRARQIDAEGNIKRNPLRCGLFAALEVVTQTHVGFNL